MATATTRLHVLMTTTGVIILKTLAQLPVFLMIIAGHLICCAQQRYAT